MSDDKKTSLELWYEAVKDKPLSEYTVGDLGRAVVQNLNREAALPFCYRILDQNPLAGDLYEGQLLLALNEIATSYWRSRPNEASRMMSYAEAAIARSEDENLKFRLRNFMSLFS